MPQLHLYVPDEVAARLRERAEARGQSLSRYLAELLTEKLTDDWPEGYFERVVGSWQGDPLERPPQGEFELRDGLDVPAGH